MVSLPVSLDVSVLSHSHKLNLATQIDYNGRNPVWNDSGSDLSRRKTYSIWAISREQVGLQRDDGGEGTKPLPVVVGCKNVPPTGARIRAIRTSAKTALKALKS